MDNKQVTHAPILTRMEEEWFWERLRLMVRTEMEAALNEAKYKINPDNSRVDGLTQKPLLDMEDVRHLFGGVSRSTIYEWIRAGVLKPRKLRGKVFFLWTDIEPLWKGKDTMMPMKIP